MNALFDWFGNLVREDAVHRTQIRILPGHVIGSETATVAAVAEEHYVRIWLAEMFLRDNGSWFTKRYPLTYSLITLDAGGQSSEHANVSGKNRLEIKPADLGQAILVNYPMTPLLPFRGGTIGLDCGLVSMIASNMVQKFAGVVSDFAGKLASAQVSAGVNLAGSVAASVQDLLGAGDAVSKLYYHNAFAAGPGGAALTSGHILLSERPAGEIDPATLWVTEDGIRQGARGQPLQPLAPQDYMLLQIEIVGQRDDYRAFDYIRRPFEAALEARGDGDDDKGKTLLGVARNAVRDSADFTELDRKRIRAGLTAGYASDGWLAGNEGREAVAPDPFETAVGLVSLEQARRLAD